MNAPPRKQTLLGPKIPRRKKSAQHKSVALARDMRGIPSTTYQLPKDGRKWRQMCDQRKHLAEWLATFGDSDGSRIFPSIATIQASFDNWSRRKILYLLKDLRELGILKSEGLRGERGPRIRRLVPDAFGAIPTRAEVQDSPVLKPEAEVSDS